MLGRVLVQADGAPAGNLSQVQQFIKTDRLYMDTASNPAALNYTLHQACVRPARNLYPKQHGQLIHLVRPATAKCMYYCRLVTGLKPGASYYYRVGSYADGLSADVRGGVENGEAGGWSDIIAFTAFPPADREPIWAMYGDMGATTDSWRAVAPSIPVLTQEQEDGVFDGVSESGAHSRTVCSIRYSFSDTRVPGMPLGAMVTQVMHAGDYAYDLAPYGGRVGDRFMNLIQPFASRVPYMAGIGNHESGGTNRKHFSMRFAGMEYVGQSSNASNAGNGDHGDQVHGCRGVQGMRTVIESRLAA